MRFKTMEWADAIIRIIFFVGFIVHVFAAMNFAIEQDVLRTMVSCSCVYICASKL